MSGFKALKSDEKIKVVTQMQAFETQIYFKFLDSEVFKVKPTSSGAGRMISCKRPPSLPITYSNQRVTMNFVLNSEVYFMNTVLAIDARQIHFSLDSDLFLLARRKSKRLRVSPESDAMIMIKRINDQTAFLRAPIVDISGEGCRLALNTDTPSIPVNARIEGTIRVPNKQGVDIQAVVKNRRASTKGAHKQIFGIEFAGLSAYTSSRIQGLILEIQRELLLKALE
jgi:hypothetical protein